MSEIGLKVDQLLLDAENPRIGSADSQRDALQKILDDQEVKLFSLAESIVTDGLSPLERLLVIRESESSSRYVALDGNRRVAALKILKNPHILTDLQIRSSLQKRFELLASKVDLKLIEPVDCFEVKKREDATTWIYRRHIGEDQGRGVVGWTGIAKARFRGRDPALQALDFVLEHGNLSAEQKKEIEENFPITTLERLIDSPDVRKLLGLEVVSRQLRSGLPADELIKPLRRIVMDLANREIRVTAVKAVRQQVEYVKSFKGADSPNLGAIGRVRGIDEISSREFKEKQEPKPRKRATTNPSERKTIAPRLKLEFGDQGRSASIFNELKTLRVDDYPNSGAVLFRVFLELSVDCYMEKAGLSLRYKTSTGKLIGKELKLKISEVIEHLVNQAGCNRKDFSNVVRGLSIDHSPLSVNLLHDYVHNRFVTPKSKDLISAWDDSQRFFEQVWK